jgi:hypothetical protein
MQTVFMNIEAILDDFRQLCREGIVVNWICTGEIKLNLPPGSAPTSTEESDRTQMLEITSRI